MSESQRRFVAERAGHRCEYCLLHEDDSYSPHQVDHIISRKHGGSSEVDNLAYACLRCNSWKGSDVGSWVSSTRGANVGRTIFVLRGALVEPLTAEGEATVRLLKLNLDRRVVERQLLMAAERYPR